MLGTLLTWDVGTARAATYYSASMAGGTVSNSTSPPTFRSPYVTLVQGTTWTVTYTVGSFSGTTTSQGFYIGEWCQSSDVADGYVLFQAGGGGHTSTGSASYVSGPTSAGTGTYVVSGTVTIAGCTQGDGFLQQWNNTGGYSTTGNGGVFTYDSGISSGPTPTPGPTASPTPTAVPTPTPTAAPTGFVPVPTPAYTPAPGLLPPLVGDAQCGDGHVVAVTGGTGCHYASDGNEDADPAGSGAAGPACRANFVTANACRVADTGHIEIPVAFNADNVLDVQQRGTAVAWMTLPTGAHQAQAGIGGDCRDAGGGVACNSTIMTAYPALRFWSAAGVQLGYAREAVNITSGASSYGVGGSWYAVPDGTYGITVEAQVASPRTSSSTHFDSISAVAIWTLTATGGIVPQSIQGCVTACQGPGVDPNTGKLICGPLSGDCSKTFITPGVLTMCVIGTDDKNPLDWFGWLGCNISNLPTSIYNFAVVPALNTIIDLLEPGQGLTIDAMNFRASIAGRFPLSWIGPVSSQIAAFGAAPYASDAGLPGSVTVYGRSVAPFAGAGSIVATISPYRPALVILVRVGFAMWVLREILGLVGRRNQPEQLGFGL